LKQRAHKSTFLHCTQRYRSQRIGFVLHFLHDAPLWTFGALFAASISFRSVDRASPPQSWRHKGQIMFSFDCRRLSPNTFMHSMWKLLPHLAITTLLEPNPSISTPLISVTPTARTLCGRKSAADCHPCLPGRSRTLPLPPSRADQRLHLQVALLQLLP
jgi:hypothetical protein